VRAPFDVEAVEAQRSQNTDVEYQHADASSMQAEEEDQDLPTASQPLTRDGRKVGRNEACPCGSGKKFKNCHGQVS
jgi:preprotein translocase subunit SecA